MLRRLFEIPYNFDTRLIDILKILLDDNQFTNNFFYDDDLFSIYCIYVPPFFQDCKVNIRNQVNQDFMKLLTKSQYENHLNHINSAFPGKIQLLINDKEMMTEEKIQEYHEKYNINKFCVNSEKQAKIIRQIIPNAEITASITMKLTYDEILKLDDSLFNNIVLFFNFNKDFELITKLPQKFNYILLVNSFCSIKCDGVRHWEAFEELPLKKFYCPNIENIKEDSIMIRPMDLSEFDKYIYAYKLQDRSWSTVEIIKYLFLSISNNYFEKMLGIEPFNKNKFYSTEKK